MRARQTLVRAAPRRCQGGAQLLHLQPMLCQTSPEHPCLNLDQEGKFSAMEEL